MGDILFLIPARGGSKRLPRKNALPLAGKPLIAWTIEAAMDSGLGGELCVSTDDYEIAEISKKAGANVPFMRPEQISNDSASTTDVVSHALSFYDGIGRKFETLILLQPTSPSRTGEDIRQAYALFIERCAERIVSVCPVDHSPLWSNTLGDDYSMEGFINPAVIGKRSQDLPQYYRLNGAIYISTVSGFLKEKSFISGSRTYAYIMSRKHSIDIDTIDDFKYAEYLNLVDTSHEDSNK